MKPFNLEEATAGKPVITRDGRKVTEIAYFHTKNSSEFTLVCIVDGMSQWYTKEGSGAINVQSRNDLFMATPEKWVNVYYNKDRDTAWCSLAPYETEEDAKITGLSETNYQATIKLIL